MKLPNISIIDYGAGNLRNVARAFEAIGFPAVVTTDPKTVAQADAVILPGVGAAGDTVDSLTTRGIAQVVQETIARDRPFFGVCVGLQVLFQRTEEGGAECLGILPGEVRRLPSTVKIPHIGWNQVNLTERHPLFEGVEDNSDFYFVHSYYAEPQERETVAGQTDYGTSFCSFMAKGNLVATQFHPEKSGTRGLRLYENFVKLVVGAGS